MKILKIALNILAYIIVLVILFVISLFLNFKGNIVFSIIIAVIGVACVAYGFAGLIKKHYKIYRFFSLGLMLLFSVKMIYSTNLKVLKKTPEAVSVYSMVRKGMDAEKKANEYNSVFKTSNYESITLMYHPDLEPALKLINTYLKQAEEDTSKLFPNIEQKPLTVKFDYDEKVFKDLNPDSIDFSGIYFKEKSRINILAENCYSDILAATRKSDDFKKTVLHEYSHYKLNEYIEKNNLLRENVPAWFNEGVASYIGYEGAGGNNEPKTLMSLKELTNSKDWDKHSNETEGAVYVQAHYTVSKLILLKGEKVIQDILLKTKGLSFATAFKETMGLSLEDYEKELEKDMKSGWKSYRKLMENVSVHYSEDIHSVNIQSLEEYVEVNPNNIKALFDLEILYSGVGNYEKAKEKLNRIIDKEPKNGLAWRRLAIVLVDMKDFDAALEAYEEEISVSEDNYDSYMSIAHILLLSDTEKAALMAKKGVQYNKVKYISNQEQEIKNFIQAVKNNKPYEGCLRLMKSNTVNSVTLKKALIEKVISDYPNIKNAARNQLEKINKSLK